MLIINSPVSAACISILNYAKCAYDQKNKHVLAAEDLEWNRKTRGEWTPLAYRTIKTDLNFVDLFIRGPEEFHSVVGGPPNCYALYGADVVL
ncbi:hypothetical protein WA026_003577 [Henosepilachna vigintioctopunctata]|uniref:Uncharacterized protein n=1 Tax=Henosepilachna vigintioctopunctata TaxID=420089 RepID=A0AAW1TN90_9CUCU